MPDDTTSAVEQAVIEGAIERRLADGWRPSRHQERTWVRGAVHETINEDRDSDELPAPEAEPMTADEEQVLITRQWSGRD